MTKELKSKVFIPENYKSNLSLIETEIAIKKVKDFFENKLAETLNLTRVSAPLFLENSSGLNDNLNGIERPVSFDMLAIKDSEIEIVHSLAKWKRFALHRYNFQPGYGLYTDMNAIRRDEELDNLHSIYVDQWDWEKVITKEERTVDTLKSTVKKIFSVFKATEDFVSKQYPSIEENILPQEIRQPRPARGVSGRDRRCRQRADKKRDDKRPARNDRRADSYHRTKRGRGHTGAHRLGRQHFERIRSRQNAAGRAQHQGAFPRCSDNRNRRPDR